MKRKLVFLWVLMCMVSMRCWADKVTYVASVTCNGTTTPYETFGLALNAANSLSGATITLLADDSYGTNGSGLLNIISSMTIDGNGHTLSGYGNRGDEDNPIYTTLAINNEGTSIVDVTIKDLTIKSSAKNARPIETRGKITSLTLENVTINATGSGTNQALTIGGNQSTIAKINIKNSSISAGKQGYPIRVFNPVDISVDSSTFYGITAMELNGKQGSEGSRGTTVTAKNSKFDVSGATSMFRCYDDGVSVELDDCCINTSLSAIASCSLFTLKSSGRTEQQCSLTIKGDDTKINVQQLVTAEDGTAPMTCQVYGGIYTVQPDAAYIAPGKTVEDNTDDATNDLYKYVVAGGSADNVTGTIYAGSSDATADQTLTQFAAVRNSMPNAIMIVDEKYASLVQDQTNVVVRYSAGSAGNYLYECPNFQLTDWVTDGADNCADFYTPVNFIAVSGSYTRTLHSNSQSCCLPFGVSKSDDMKIQIFSYYENAGDSRQYAYFTQPDSVSAGVPCLLNCDEATTYTKEFKNTEIAKVPNNAYNMKGTFVASGDYNQTYCYGMMDTGEQFGAAPATLYPFRTVLSLQDDSGSSITDAKSINIAILDEEGNATAIDGTPIQIPHFNSDNSIYTITGIKVADTHIPGLYIIHGRKVLAR